MLINETTVRVRYEETDQMGVVYYANYMVWFEVGRTELMREFGLPYREFEENDLFFPVLRAYCEYKEPASYDDQLTIITRIKNILQVRVTIDYEICRADKLLAKGYTEHAFVNGKGKPVILKKTNPKIWKRLLEVVGN